MTFDRPLDALDGAALQALVDSQVPEGRQLEYKETLPGNSDREKLEFLADVSAFANSAGGDVIYGVREVRGEGGQPTAVAAAVVGLPGRNPDAERLRLEQLVRSCLKPPIPGFQVKVVDRGREPFCLVVRIPRSWVGPHMVTYRGHDKFYGRSAGGRYRLPWEELRDAFVGAETAAQRARTFRADRLFAIEAGEGPVPVHRRPLLVFHVIPLVRWEGWDRFVTASDSDRRRFVPLLRLSQVMPAGDSRFNLDGFVRFVESPGSTVYAQLFRETGAIEHVAEISLVLEASGGTSRAGWSNSG